MLVVGGESGSGKSARRMDPAWAQSLLVQGHAAGIAVFMKQTGSVLARELGLADPKGENPAGWPDRWNWPRGYPTAGVCREGASIYCRRSRNSLIVCNMMILRISLLA